MDWWTASGESRPAADAWPRRFPHPPTTTNTMATFRGKEPDSIEWRVELDAPTIEEVIEKHQINLVDLESDPLIQLRGNPMKLVAVIYLICQEQVEKAGLDPKQFARQLPSPPDPMLDALQEAIVGFFPTGRASHVREALAKLAAMAEEMDKIKIEQMQAVLVDPKLKDRVRRKVETSRGKLMEELFPTS